MLRKLLPVLLILALCSSCGKSKFETKPTLTLKSQSNAVPADNEAQFSITLKFTDKEGDLSGAADSSLVYTAVALNVRRLDGGTQYPYAYTKLPEFPDKSSGEIELRPFRSDYYRDLTNPAEGEDRNDTIVFKIVVKDRAGHVSDTLTTKPIVLYGE